MRDFTTIDLEKMRTRGAGVQKPENLADVLYVWFLTQLIINPSISRFSVWRPLCARLHAEMKVVERRRRVRALHQRRKKDKKVRDCLKSQYVSVDTR